MIKLCKNILISTLITFLALSGCSNNQAIKSRYELEKLFYKAEKDFEAAQAFQQQLSDDKIGEFINIYSEFFEQTKSTLEEIDKESNNIEFNEISYLLLQGSNRLAQLYFARNEFDSCIAIYEYQLNNIQVNRDYRASTMINLGQSLQSAGKWDSALVVFDVIIKNYYPPVLSTGEVNLAVFNLPTGILRAVSYRNDENTTRFRFNETENYYLNLINDYPDTKLEIASRANLSRIYDEAGLWEKELQQLDALSDSTKSSYFEVMLKKAEIYYVNLKRFDTSTNIVNHLLEKAVDKDTLRIPVLKFKLGQIKMGQKKYDEARKLISDVKKDYFGYYSNNPQIQYAYARSFEFDNKWSRAEMEYSLLIEKFNQSREAMSAYLHLFDNFNKEKRTGEADRWFEEASKHYQTIADQNPNSNLEALALTYKAELFGRKSDWRGTVDILKTIYDKFSETDIGINALKKAAEIYKENLNDSKTADSLFNILKNRNLNFDYN